MGAKQAILTHKRLVYSFSSSRMVVSFQHREEGMLKRILVQIALGSAVLSLVAGHSLRQVPRIEALFKVPLLSVVTMFVMHGWRLLDFFVAPLVL